MGYDVFLMGTAGNSTWRKAFEDRLEAEGLNYFNPVKPNWTPDDAAIEAEALADSSAIVLIVTTDTDSFGSLAEIGFTILNAVLGAFQNGQQVFLCVEQYTGDEAKAHDASKRTRDLVLAHLEKLDDAYGLLPFYLYESRENVLEAVVNFLNN